MTDKIYVGIIKQGDKRTIEFSDENGNKLELTEEKKENLFNQILLINKQDKMHEVLEEAFEKKRERKVIGNE